MGGVESVNQPRVISSPRAQHARTLSSSLEASANMDSINVSGPEQFSDIEHSDGMIEPLGEISMAAEAKDSFEKLVVEYPKGMGSRSSRMSSRRSSVSAETDKDPRSSVVRKKYVPKTAEQKASIMKVLEDGSCFLFDGLDPEQKTQLLNAVEVVEFKEGDTIIKQWGDGAEAEYFYILAAGKAEVYKSFGPRADPGEEKYIYTYVDSGYFGELALMYNSPRTATIKATSDATLYALDRESFRRIIIDSTRQKRERYEQFIQSVDLLQGLTHSNRAQIADTLGVKHYKKGDVIVQEGEVGDAMYFIEAGCASVNTLLTPEEAKAELVRLESTGDLTAMLQEALENKAPEIHARTLSRGEYFGERALLMDERRSATVTAESEEVRCLVVHRDIFERLLGPLSSIMELRFKHYVGLSPLKASKRPHVDASVVITPAEEGEEVEAPDRKSVV